MVDVYGFHVGKSTIYMDHMGIKQRHLGKYPLGSWLTETENAYGTSHPDPLHFKGEETPEMRESAENMRVDSY